MIYCYDGTFEGLLTCIFESYHRKEFPVEMVSRVGEQKLMFAGHREVVSDPAKADRVWPAVQKKMSVKNKELLFYAFLSGEPGIEMKVYRFVRRLFSGEIHPETDYGDAGVLALTQISRKVKQEAMRMMQFARFQHTRDGLYFCRMEPRYDVIPLVVEHFQKRFSDQKWLLYDLKRNYGILHENGNLDEVVVSARQFSSETGQAAEDVLQEGEEFYQKLWQSYFTHINIKERKNLRLQRQHMPRRFWKYLPEMQV